MNENVKVKDEYDFKEDVSEPSIAQTSPGQHSNVSAREEVAIAREHPEYLIPELAEKATVEHAFWPVETEQEALLIRHFSDTVSHFFDFCDPERHFGRIVPQRARSNSTLSSAVLALSARHLSRTSTFDALVADVHYHRCLRQLIPQLAEGAKDDCLLAATVILRLMEEFDVPINGRDSQNHLAGTQAIVRAQEQQLRNPSDPSGLLEAAHWSALRQDLYVSIATRRPMQLNSLEHFRTAYQPAHMASSPHGGDDQDAEWANLAILQCCDISQFAFGPNNHDTKTYSRLKTTNEDWRRYKPTSFDPYYYRRDTTTGLPDIRMLADWHVMGYMYNLFAQLLLCVYKPQVSEFDDKHMQSSTHDVQQIQQTVREMAGIAVSNSQAPAAMLVASMAIAMCGDRFENPNERNMLDRILFDTEAVQGWPTISARQSLGGLQQPAPG